MRNFKKLALVGAFAVVTAFSVTACGSSNGTTQEATTVDSQAEQDSKRDSLQRRTVKTCRV